ncbi:MAG: undecaprenyldiphospho-muramoylpentapeptide beta-N-acetylglucosaminyltransferase [Pseudomonadales bacterium]
MTQVTRTLLIMAGGTGGHVFPALAVAREMRQRGYDVQWMGTLAGIEARLVPAESIPLHFISITGVRGKGLLTKLKVPFLLIGALWQSMKILNSVKPCAVLGMGGFAAGPGGLAAAMKRVPLLIHEQNAIAGTTNRILHRVAQYTLQGFSGSFDDGEFTGNPVRNDITNLPAPEIRMEGRSEALRLLVLGGSLGAVVLNEILPLAVAKIDAAYRPQIRHQCGRDRSQEVSARYADAGVDARADDFIGDMAEAYGWADLAVCRAGALTVAELACAGLGALMVPYPHAIDDHQTANARWLEQQGGGLVLPQSTISVDSLAQQLEVYCRDRKKTLTMAISARASALPQAVSTVADRCEEACRG